MEELGLLSRLELSTGIKDGFLVPVGGSNRDKRPLGPHATRLAVGPGTKALFGSGPKGSRDKWPGTKAYPVVVYLYDGRYASRVQARCW